MEEGRYKYPDAFSEALALKVIISHRLSNKTQDVTVATIR